MAATPDLAIVWLYAAPGHPGEVVEKNHCAHCPPYQHTRAALPARQSEPPPAGCFPPRPGDSATGIRSQS